MQSIKSYTDIEQSRKLAEILPLESADMYRVFENNAETRVYYGKAPTAHFVCEPCWSVAALMDIFPDEITDDGDVYRNMSFHLKGKYIIQYPRLTTLWPSLLSVEADNYVDACCQMVLKLHELNLL